MLGGEVEQVLDEDRQQLGRTRTANPVGRQQTSAKVLLVHTYRTARTTMGEGGEIEQFLVGNRQRLVRELLDPSEPEP